MTATQGIVAARAQSIPRGEQNDQEDQSERCVQLFNAPPEIEELRRKSDGGLESREIRLDASGPGPRWVGYRPKGNAAPWRSQSTIARLHFSPPFYDAIPDHQPRFLVYAKSVAETAQDSEQMMSAAQEFGNHVGTFEWRDKVYNYAVVDKLPCFPGPE